MSANVSAPASEAKRKAIVARTLSWWDRRRRSLAWRAGPGETPDPYRVWLSEVLLQQTTAQAATPYYQAFIAKWPQVQDLAAAPLEAVIERLRRPRLLFARAQPARLRQGDRPARRPVSGRGSGVCARFPASAPIPPRRSPRSPSAVRPCRSTAISPASWRGSSRSRSRSPARAAKSRPPRGRSRQPREPAISPRR